MARHEKGKQMKSETFFRILGTVSIAMHVALSWVLIALAMLSVYQEKYIAALLCLILYELIEIKYGIRNLKNVIKLYRGGVIQ